MRQVLSLSPKIKTSLVGVHVWGHLMDNFLMNAPGLNFNREKQSGSFTSGPASSRIYDAILLISKDSKALYHPVCILHEEETPPLKPGGNEELWNCLSRNVPLNQFKSNQGGLVKLFRSMRATFVRRKASHDERLRCYDIQWVGSRVGIFYVCWCRCIFCLFSTIPQCVTIEYPVHPWDIVCHVSATLPSCRGSRAPGDRHQIEFSDETYDIPSAPL